jgi:hypothetical protein
MISEKPYNFPSMVAEKSVKLFEILLSTANEPAPPVPPTLSVEVKMIP